MKRSYEFPEKINRDKKFSSAEPLQSVSDIFHQLDQLREEQTEKSISKEDIQTSYFRIDPLQIQISLKLQDLLCKALDDRYKNGATLEEAEWQDLSRLLQDFLSSAKKKISFSLTADKPLVPSGAAAACDKGNPFSDTRKKNHHIQNKVLQTSPESIFSVMEDDSSSDSQRSGILLLGEAEKAPDYLDLSLEVEGDSEIDDPGFKNDDSDDEEVVVLGEKKPTYQEITLDEEGEVGEQVVEQQQQKKKVRIPKDLEDLLYDCPKCEKKFRVESLLKFHIRMHSVVESHAAPPAATSLSTETPPRRSKSRKQKENKLSHQHKIQKHSKRKVKITS